MNEWPTTELLSQEIEQGNENTVNTDIIDDPEVLTKRENNIISLKEKLDFALTEYNSALSSSENGRIENELSEKIIELEKQIIEAEANYPGDQTLLLRDRLLHPSTEEKLNDTYEKHKDSFSQEELNRFSKARNYRFYQERHVKEFQERVTRLFQLTEFGKAENYAESPVNLGVKKNLGESYDERFSHHGAVFTDAETKQGAPLTERQKNIIEAHEKGHTVREFSGKMANEIQNVLDFSTIPENERGYFRKNADEIIERMSQFKNYFGFKDNEQFTKAHLDYARKNYIKDTGLDNNMQTFFDAVTPEKEKYFLEIINSYPI